jgi:hypothetical protein
MWHPSFRCNWFFNIITIPQRYIPVAILAQAASFFRPSSAAIALLPMAKKALDVRKAAQVMKAMKAKQAAVVMKVMKVEQAAAVMKAMKAKTAAVATKAMKALKVTKVTQAFKKNETAFFMQAMESTKSGTSSGNASWYQSPDGYWWKTWQTRYQDKKFLRGKKLKLRGLWITGGKVAECWESDKDK